MNFDYYYGDESNQFAFYRIPRQLITGEAFKKLSTDAKLLYGLLLDRMGLSAKNGWYDDMGRVFIYYTLDEIQEDLNCGHEKAVRLLAELDTGKKGFGLIERVKQGQGRPTKIYVKRFTTRAIPPQPAAPQDIPRLPIFGSQDFGKAEVKSSEKQKSRLPVIGSADFRKSDTSYIESNQTDLSQLYPSIHPSATVPESRWIDRSECRREVQEAIEFPLLCQQFGYEDVESVTELIVDTLCSTRPTFRIGGAEMPAEQVKGRLQMLDNGHLEYVFDCMRRNTTEIPLGQGRKDTLGIFILRFLLQGGTEHLLDSPPALGKHLLSFCREGMSAAVKDRLSFRCFISCFKRSSFSCAVSFRKLLPVKRTGAHMEVSLS